MSKEDMLLIIGEYYYGKMVLLDFLGTDITHEEQGRLLQLSKRWDEVKLPFLFNSIKAAQDEYTWKWYKQLYSVAEEFDKGLLDEPWDTE